MARLYLFAEGQTEQTFADNLIKPHLVHYNVFMNKPVLIAHTKKKGRVHRGGGRNYAPIKNDIIRFLKQDKATDVFFTTMIDLYAIHPDFPGLAEAELMRQDPFERVKFLEQKFAEDIGDPRFIPYIQLHEYEAYLFSEPTCFDYLSSGRTQEIETLQAIASQYKTPELINDGLQTAPSKRIIAQFPDYGRAKSTFGPQLAERIGLQSIREHCLHFDEWLFKLESLDGQSSNS
ncbi:DUF4276 family protein [Phormidium pseudopriestleyi FRX01]|uniref:DUF4276 family protein n=1 Tax=Phormidium pseudopriestleyi FRX01 TaxID=1759528 RepID=A0ABS3FQZ7_9CYAN|nr:DUF4276 family protein [Phormidium pseudopriestleyi]MBO0349555.1 DUF4276 family protein [Phormidium pseudopriestleyi FRX01]